jgi:subtilisin family serine protease
LDVSIVVLQGPAGMSTRRALERLRREDPEGTYDYNHIYLESGAVGAAAPSVASASVALAAGAAELAKVASNAAVGAAETLEAVSAGTVAAGVKVGLIDGGIQRAHPVFNGVSVHEHGCSGGAIPSAHGTAVASLLVGQGDVFHGAAPGAELFAADVYCGLASGGALDSVADAFAWMSRERVPVISISLVGPANTLLEQIIRVVTTRGHIVVAAVGNDGPSSPPLYPAAYPEVVAVTGVDAKDRVLVEACRGKHVDFAAPGANMSAAGVEAPFSIVRGTSFAAPIVAGLLARQLVSIDKSQAESALSALAAEAKDLGARGVDKIYGNGLVGESLRPPEQLAASSSRKAQ